MSDRDPVELLVQDFVDRFRRGERPAISEYAERYPEHAERVRALFPSLVVMEDLASGDNLAFEESKHATALAEDLPLEQLGDYRIIREVGRGGMGLVYEAEQLSLGRQVALKVLSRRALKNPRQIKRFEHEARAAARLHHTNIVPVFDVGEHDGILFYVMQFIQGASLDQVLEDVKRLRDAGRGLPASRPGRSSQAPAWEVSLSEVAASRNATAHHGRTPPREPTHWHEGTATLLDDGEPPVHPASQSLATSATPPTPALADEDTALNLLGDTSTFSGRALLPGTTEAAGRHATSYWESVARIGVQVADALAYAHAQGITHRDIKPSNLLLDTRATVWITDFGLAKTRDQEDLTHTGDFVGTLRYMAPERFAENADAAGGESDPRADIYSLGLTLYELLAFQPAFDELERPRLMRQVVEGTPVRLRKINSDVPRDLETIVHKAIERDPNHRIQTAEELASDLRRFLDDEPIRARRVSAPERVWRWCRRNPGISWTTLVAALAVLATVVAAFAAITGERNRFERLANENQQLADEKERLARDERVARMAMEGMRDDEKRRADMEQRLRQEAEQLALENRAIVEFLTRDVLATALPEIHLGRDLTMREVLDNAARLVGDRYEGNPRTEAAIRHTIGRAYNSLGVYADAERQLTRALEQQRKLLGESHRFTLDTQNSLAISLNFQGRYAEGRAQQEQIVKTLIEHEQYGPEHIETLVAMSNLSTTYYRLGMLEECLEMQAATLAALRKNFGATHEQTIRTLVNLAATQHDLGHYEETHVLLEEAARNRKRNPKLADVHPLTLSILTNQSLNLVKLGRPREAEQHARRALAVQRQVLGDEHPSTLVNRNNIALALDHQGKYAEAHAIHEDVLAARVRILGDDHPDTLATRTNLAANLVHQHRFDDAQRIYSELIASSEKKLGLEHRLTLKATNNQAEAFRAQGMYAVAHQEFTRVVGLARQALGDDHRATLRFRRNLADNLERQGQIDEAEREYREVLKVYEDRYGAGDRARIWTVQELALLLIRHNRHADAAALLRETLAAAEQAEADREWQIASIHSLLGEALARQKDYAQAERALLAAHQRLATLPLAPPHELRLTLQRLVDLYEAWDDPDHQQSAERWRAELKHLGPATGPPPKGD